MENILSLFFQMSATHTHAHTHTHTNKQTIKDLRARTKYDEDYYFGEIQLKK